MERVEFISVGNFFDQAPYDYMLGDRTPRKYRNTFLVTAMAELNLIDHMGSGIHRMVDQQRKRFLPLPDYEKPGWWKDANRTCTFPRQLLRR